MPSIVVEPVDVGLPRAKRLLQEVFGFPEFREGQADVVTRLLEGRSSLAIFPTGSGKSLCYQLPALILDGLTVVISPLIALMKDQIDFLVERKIPAARLDSSLDRESAARTYDDLRARRTRILYVSPERLGNERFLQLLERQSISLLAVDEAHCISEWGHNFRPDYLKIAALARQLRVGRVLALTATATPEVAADIATAFEIDADDVVQTGFYRPNLNIRVTSCAAADRAALLADRLRSRPVGPTIVYVTLQRTASQIAAYLSKCGFSARAYHAGLTTEERTEVQDAFMAADEMIVVATIAFGMGIDKSNIRAVYHYNLPRKLHAGNWPFGSRRQPRHLRNARLRRRRRHIGKLFLRRHSGARNGRCDCWRAARPAGGVRCKCLRSRPAARCPRSGREDIAHIPRTRRYFAIDRAFLHRVQISAVASLIRDIEEIRRSAC
jgi:ATP-dependent DNA helicase RecQ